MERALRKTEVHAPQTWLEIPEELLIKIFSYCKQEDINNLRHTCKTWRERCGEMRPYTLSLEYHRTEITLIRNVTHPIQGIDTSNTPRKYSEKNYQKDIKEDSKQIKYFFPPREINWQHNAIADSQTVENEVNVTNIINILLRRYMGGIQNILNIIKNLKKVQRFISHTTEQFLNDDIQTDTPAALLNYIHSMLLNKTNDEKTKVLCTIANVIALIIKCLEQAPLKWKNNFLRDPDNAEKVLSREVSSYFKSGAVLCFIMNTFRSEKLVIKDAEQSRIDIITWKFPQENNIYIKHILALDQTNLLPDFNTLQVTFPDLQDITLKLQNEKIIKCNLPGEELKDNMYSYLYKLRTLSRESIDTFSSDVIGTPISIVRKLVQNGGLVMMAGTKEQMKLGELDQDKITNVFLCLPNTMNQERRAELYQDLSEYPNFHFHLLCDFQRLNHDFGVPEQVDIVLHSKIKTVYMYYGILNNHVLDTEIIRERTQNSQDIKRCFSTRHNTAYRFSSPGHKVVFTITSCALSILSFLGAASSSAIIGKLSAVREQAIQIVNQLQNINGAYYFKGTVLTQERVNNIKSIADGSMRYKASIATIVFWIVFVITLIAGAIMLYQLFKEWNVKIRVDRILEEECKRISKDTLNITDAEVQGVGHGVNGPEQAI